MAYTHKNSRGKEFILHSQTVQLKSGREQVIYYFAGQEKEGALDAVPEGFEVAESKSGMLVLKKAG